MPVKIGEQEYSEEQLEQALKAQAKMQELAPVMAMAERYRLSPEEVVQNAEGAFGQIIQLQEMGVLDENGKLVQKRSDAPSSKQEQAPPSRQEPSTNSFEAIITKALSPVSEEFKQMKNELNAMKDYQGRLFRERIMEKVQRKHPQLTDEDVSMLVAKAQATKEDFWQLAENKVKTMDEGKQETIKSFAQEYGLNLEELNKMKEMRSSEGGIASVVLEGKKVSSKKGDGNISPKEAMMSYLETAERLEKE